MHHRMRRAVAGANGGVYSARSIIVDAADNWGNTTLLASRMLELKLAGVLRSATIGVNVDSYFTSNFGVPTYVMMFDTNNDKIGSWANECWASGVGSPANQRAIGVYSDLVDFDALVMNNALNDGGVGQAVNTGLKNIKIYTSQIVYTDTTYGLTTGLVKIFDGVLAIHSLINQVEDQSLTLIG